MLAFCIAPGFTDTEMVTGTMDPTAIAEATSDIPLGRMASPEEIGALAAFLCDDRVRHMTGAMQNARCPTAPPRGRWSR